LFTITVLTLFLVLVIDLIDAFLSVATKVALPVVERPLIISSLPPLVIVNLSDVNISVPPSLFVTIYLSSSKGKKVSPVFKS
jgi:hypothetical protein